MWFTWRPQWWVTAAEGVKLRSRSRRSIWVLPDVVPGRRVVADPDFAVRASWTHRDAAADLGRLAPNDLVHPVDAMETIAKKRDAPDARPGRRRMARGPDDTAPGAIVLSATDIPRFVAPVST
jgi:hypothetical protein